MSAGILERLAGEVEAARTAGRFKQLRTLETGPGARRKLNGRDVLVMCSNDYQGLAKAESVVAAALAATREYGVGPASVRFICGTLPVHEVLERKLAAFLGTEAAFTFSSAWSANAALYPVLAAPGDVIFSDALNHASIIDGCRATAKGVVREIYAHADTAQLEDLLERHKDAPGKIIVTDGVFSMEGDLAPLPKIAELARRYGALLVVDDSHGLGVIGKTGRGAPEVLGVLDKVDIHVGTLGKTLGGGSGGFVAGPRIVIEGLIQKARPQLFSNGVPPGIAAASAVALDIIDSEPQRMASLAAKTALFRAQLRSHGAEPLAGDSAIVPIIIGESKKSAKLSAGLLDAGILATSFAFPVVPEGEARIRFQISQLHSDQDLAWAAQTVGALVRTL